MKRVTRNILIASFIVISLMFGSCAKQDGQRLRRQKFQVVSIDKVRGSISNGWKISLTVANNTASNMRIIATNAFIKNNGKKIGRLSLDGEVFLPRRRCSQVEVPLRITLSNPIAALSVFNKIRKGDFSDITIDYNITIATLTSHRSFEQENVSLEQLAKQFNLGLKK